MSRLFVLNFHRTGTRSISEFFLRLGWRAVHYPRMLDGRDLERELDGTEPNEVVWSRILPAVLNHDVCSDVPFPSLYREAYREFPDARFLYLHRDASDWAKAAHRFLSQRTYFTPFERIQYRDYIPAERLRRTCDVDVDLLKAAHVAHFESLKRYFDVHAPERLLVHELGSDFGFELCRQLGFPPYVDVPHVGRTRGRHGGKRRPSGGDVSRSLAVSADTLIESARSRPDSPHLRYLAATFLLRERRRKEASVFAQEAVAQRPEHLPYRRLAIRVCLSRGSLTEAARAIASYIRQVGGLAGLFRHLALAWVRD